MLAQMKQNKNLKISLPNYLKMVLKPNVQLKNERFVEIINN